MLLEFDKKHAYFLSHSEICIFFTVWNHNQTNNNENGNHVPSQVLCCAWNSTVFIELISSSRIKSYLGMIKEHKILVCVCYPALVCHCLGILFVSVTYRTGMRKRWNGFFAMSDR